jgi:hypothetical protein
MAEPGRALAARPSPFEGSRLAGDPYVRLLRRHCEDPGILASTPGEVVDRHRELLWPFLDFFLRRDRGDYYRNLYRRKGLLDGGGVRADVALEDLGSLRIHSDDLRGPDGQRRRLIGEVAADYDSCQVFRSSGTSGHAAGPVTIARSPLMRRMHSFITGQRFEWAAGHTLDGSLALVQVAPEMRKTIALARNVPAAFENVGARVILGARIADASPEIPVWQRLAPDVDAMRAFFASPAERKTAHMPPAALAQIISDRDLIRQISPGGDDYLDLGESGVLITGGGLKRVSRYATVAELIADTGRVLKSRRDGELVPVPTADGLGLTESMAIFLARAGDPADESSWIKVPHPLTWVGLFASPQRLELVPAGEFGADRLLFFVNFMCLDYLEAVVPGDLVARQLGPDGVGYVYRRRATEGEGFAIREGCG